MKDTERAATLYKHMAFGEPSADDTLVISEQLKRLFAHSSDVKGYRQLAKVWLSVIGLAIVLAIGAVVWVLHTTPIAPVHDEYESSRSQSEFGVAVVLIVKALLILIPLLFLLRFANRSYRINKHLEVTYAHRYALQSSIEEYIRTAGPGADRQQLVRDMLPFFYSDIETGYITKKDGLGDNGMDTEALLRRLPKR